MDDKRAALIQGAIRCVARNGVGAASTRDIAECASVSDSHIYRFFKDRDELINAAYIETSNRLIGRLADNIEALVKNKMGMDREACFRLVFHKSWRDLLDDPDICRFLVYYYHSPNFMRFAYSNHNHQVERLTVLTMAFFGGLQEAVNSIYVLVSQMYDFAMQVANGLRPDNEESEEYYFGLLFSMRPLRQHMNDQNPR